MHCYFFYTQGCIIENYYFLNVGISGRKKKHGSFTEMQCTNCEEVSEKNAFVNKMSANYEDVKNVLTCKSNNNFIVLLTALLYV